MKDWVQRREDAVTELMEEKARLVKASRRLVEAVTFIALIQSLLMIFK